MTAFICRLAFEPARDGVVERHQRRPVVPDGDFLMTRHEAARAAGVTFNTIVLWIRAGRLHPVDEPGPRRRVILWSDLGTAVAREESTRGRATGVWGG
jgi:hypothetical protein